MGSFWSRLQYNTMTDQEAFVKMIQQYEGTIFKIARLYIRTETDLNDMYQEIVLQLWKAFPSFQGKSSPGTWLYRVALNTAITYLKKRKRRVETVTLYEGIDQFRADEEQGVKSQITMLYEMVSKLDGLDKGLVLLYLENKSHQEIADIIGISVSNVGTRINRIKKKLKQQAKQLAE